MFLHAIRLLAATLAAHEGPSGRPRGARAGHGRGGLGRARDPGRARMGMGHALAHAIGGRYKTPHATTHAILIAPVHCSTTTTRCRRSRPAIRAGARRLRKRGRPSRGAAGIERMRGPARRVGHSHGLLGPRCVGTRRSRTWRRRRWTTPASRPTRSRLARRRRRGYPRAL
jgi:alcohol dehydrogenase class IV